MHRAADGLERPMFMTGIIRIYGGFRTVQQGKMMRRFTITSEHFLQYLEAWVHGGPEPARRIACLIQNIPICFLNAHRKSTSATYFIHEVTAETSAESTDYKVGEVELDGTVIENNERPQ
jgi:hypothetical protein